MKEKSKVMKILGPVLFALWMVHATASPVFANNAPGPLAFVSIFSLLLFIVILTLMGGGSTVRARLRAAKHPSKAKRILMDILEFTAGVVLFFVGIMTTVIGVAGFSIYALARGIRMILWARAAGKKERRPQELEGVDPKRLRFAGIALIVLTLLVLGYSMIHIDDVTGAGEWRKRAYVNMLNAEARKARDVADQYLRQNPGARAVTCEDLVKAGYIPLSVDISCLSDIAAASGSISMTGPDRWKLKRPVAVITFSGELTEAAP